MQFRNIFQKIIPVVFALAITLSGCVKGDLDKPPILQVFQLSPKDTLVSIAKLKTLHNVNSTLLDTVKNNWVIKGIVISHDSCGNTYKYITIQDSSCGIMIGLDNNETYNRYKLGQRLFVKCKGLILGGQIFSLSGAHMTATQLGFREGLAIGTIPNEFKSNYIYRDGFPEKVPSPRVFATVNDIVSAKDTIIGTLITLKNVKFVADATFGPLYNKGNPAPIRNLADALGTNITLYVSPYCCFAKDSIPTPTQICDITGILSTYDANTSPPGFQLIPRYKKDIRINAQ